MADIFATPPDGLSLTAPPASASSGVRVWPVGALLRAMGEALQARFNPVAVSGEIIGFTQAASGHCYFSLKDAQGQLRCAMFRRASSLLDFAPRDGQTVELRGRLGVYEPRGELQLVVESMRQAGQGQLLEQFLRMKAKLAAEGLFDASRKRALPAMPRAIGVVTSLGAAALHDVLSALQRRVPHIPVVIYPAAVQGDSAASDLVRALRQAYQRQTADALDVLLLVRGGGAMEDLWAFNDEQLARTLAAAPMPVISGVGHETDFTLADFCADVRAPTPTAAAELCAQPQSVGLAALQQLSRRCQRALQQQLQTHAQRLDGAAACLARPSHGLTRQQAGLARLAQKLRHAAQLNLAARQQRTQQLAQRWPAQVAASLQQQRQRLERAQLRLDLLDPRLVLQRGYAWLSDAQGLAISRASAAQPGQPVRATLADGVLDLTVVAR